MSKADRSSLGSLLSEPQPVAAPSAEAQALVHRIRTTAGHVRFVHDDKTVMLELDAFAARARAQAIEECARRCDVLAQAGHPEDNVVLGFPIHDVMASSFEMAARSIRALNPKEPQ